MKLLCDMGIAAKTAASLRTLGHDAVHLDDRGDSRLTDREIVTLARAESRILVAHDLDFTDLIAVSRAQIWWLAPFSARAAAGVDIGHPVQIWWLDLFLPRLAWAYSRNQRRR